MQTEQTRQDPQTAILEVLPLPHSENEPVIDAGDVKALASIRYAGSVVIRDCRLIQQHDGTFRLYGPQVRQIPPGSESLLFKTFVDWPESEAIHLGRLAADQMNRQRGGAA